MPSSGGQKSALDRKSTRLNSSHGSISYAVFCLNKKIIQLDARHERAANVDLVEEALGEERAAWTIAEPRGEDFLFGFFFNDPAATDIYTLSLHVFFPV